MYKKDKVSSMIRSNAKQRMSTSNIDYIKTNEVLLMRVRINKCIKVYAKKMKCTAGMKVMQSKEWASVI